jgi:hypothetical protein
VWILLIEVPTFFFLGSMASTNSLLNDYDFLFITLLLIKTWGLLMVLSKQ